jgi:intein/homing endonuclease
MKIPVFVVHCERIGRRQAYYVRFYPNDQLLNRIKELPQETRKWSALNYAWEINTYSLYLLIKKYKGSDKIHFDFGNDDSRNVFIKQIQKLEKVEEEKRQFITELNIKKEKWVKYKKELETTYEQYSDRLHKILKKGVKLYPHQIVAALFMNITKSTLISHEMGLGKAEPLDSQLVTPNGLVKMGDIKVADSVIGSDGKPKKVLGVYPQGLKDIYEITFNDGTTARSCDEHLWNVNTYIRNWRGNPFMTKSLRDIMEGGLQYKNGNNKWYIPIVKPIEFKELELKIDPYVLGCLLGDGNITTRSSVGFTSIDVDIVSEIQERLPIKHNIILKKNSTKDYYISGYRKHNEIINNIRNYKLNGCDSYTKFIPEEYKFSSIQQRLEILQGILDTDGHSRKDGIIELTLASKQLIDDVQFIVQSLGGIGRIKPKYINYKNEKRKYWRITIKLPSEFIPFKLDRKIKTFRLLTKYKPNRAIVDVKYIGKKEAQCIMVDSDDHLYCTDNCILTHNTLSSILYVEMNGFEKVMVITPNSLKFNYYNEVKKFTNSQAHIINWNKNTCSLEDAKYIIVNYEYFNRNNKEKAFDRKFKALNLDKINAVICDECFTYDTKIETDKGLLKIGDIVENSLDVKVLSYNHRLKKSELKSISRYLYNGYRKVIRVKLSNGSIIECTPEHKFYSLTENKYKRIVDFNYGELLYETKRKNTNKRNKLRILWYKIQTKKKFTKILFQKLFGKLYYKRKCEKIVKNKGIEWKFISDYNEKMSIMWGRVRGERKDEEKILLPELFGKVENVTRGNKIKSSQSGNIQQNIEECYENDKRKPTSFSRKFRKDDDKQSNVQSKKCGENEKKKKWSDFSSKRWKWKINKTTINTIFRIIGNNWGRNEYGVFDTNKKTTEINKKSSDNITSNTLQSRYWDTIDEISNRSRWKFTQNKKMEVFGQKEDGNIGIVWVESIEILESGDRCECNESSDGNKRVYDLEIVDNHNYFANGILVSNCHRLKNTKSNTYKNFKRTFKKDIFVDDKVSKIFLSGTPAPNRAHELYTVLNQISPTDFTTKRHFQEYYCGMRYDLDDGWSYDAENMLTRFEELYHKIAPYTHRKRKADVLTDLPDKIYQRVIEEMDNKQQAVYDDIEKGVANEFINEEVNNPLTIMIRLRQYTAHIKLDMAMELINNILESGEKVVVVDVFKDNLFALKDKLGDIAGLHTGEQSVEERAELVKEFQDPDSNIRVFLASTQTANYGLTLTAASKLIIMTLPYSVGEYDQVYDRLHRIGQKNVVNIYPLIISDTIDDYVFSAIERKRKEIVRVLDNEDYKSNINESVLGEVIDRIKEKYDKK